MPPYKRVYFELRSLPLSQSLRTELEAKFLGHTIHHLEQALLRWHDMLCESVAEMVGERCERVGLAREEEFVR